MMGVLVLYNSFLLDYFDLKQVGQAAAYQAAAADQAVQEALAQAAIKAKSLRFHKILFLCRNRRTV